MSSNSLLPNTIAQPSDGAVRKVWQTPEIEDAEIGALTNGTGDSGVEGIPFLKPGS